MKSEIISRSSRVSRRALSPDELLTTRELMDLLKVKHRKTIYDLIQNGLPYLMVGKSYRFIKDEVIGYLKLYSKTAHQSGRTEAEGEHGKNPDHG